MSSQQFDTFSAARALQDAGVEREQAESIAAAIGHTGNYATKSDVGAVQADLETVKSDLGTVKSDLGTVKSDLGTLKSDLGTLKSDLGTLKSEMDAFRTALSNLEARLEVRMDALIAGLEARMYRALWIQGGAVIAVVTALKLLE